ncbi:MAG: chemotaxis protein CheW [Campylobacterota bacterium]|nr:chemotaxis protein CheW [Campylobacterota bacterium]
MSDSIVLKARAEKVSKLLKKEDDTKSEDMVLFILDGQNYAIEASYVFEVYRYKSITKVPCTPSFIIGVINLRGQIFSINDLRDILGMEISNELKSDKIIMVGNGKVDFGIVIDKIIGEKKIKVSEILEPPKMLPIEKKEFLSGVLLDRTVVLNIAKILDNKSILVDENIN